MAVLLAGATHVAAQPTGCDTNKWYQPPSLGQWTNVFYGWNQESVCDWLITADDWVCTNAAPVTKIRWWGSFIGWAQPQPPVVLPTYWKIHIWTDNPANQPPVADPWSHPDRIIYELVTNSIPFRCVGLDCHDDDCVAKTPSPLPIDTCYLWEVDLDPSQYFYQTNVNEIFWISITACYTNPPGDVPYPFGIKTRPRDDASIAPDAAVSITKLASGTLDPVLGDAYSEGFPLVCPDGYDPNSPTNWWDLAFELCTGEDAARAKWEQPPDLTTTGLDVNDSYDPAAPAQPIPFVLGDDFLCTQTGLITNIVIWGSWLNDLVPINGNTGLADPSHVRFLLSIYDDIPDPDGTNGPAYSRPGNLLWFGDFPQPNLAPGSFTHSIEAAGISEGWLDPPAGYIPPPADTVCHRYEFTAPFPFGQQPFLQEGTPQSPKVYWLVVQAVIPGDQPPTAIRPSFGWKTSTDHWNDDAVWARTNMFSGPIPPALWGELRYPFGHPFETLSIDLAFRLNTATGAGTGGETLKWSQPPVVYPNPTNLFYGWDEPSIYRPGLSPTYGFITNYVADDWLCTDPRPISDIHWWGSFLGWQGAGAPPLAPVGFHLAIWRDVPAGGSNNFSHPESVIWEKTVSVTDSSFGVEWVGWDIDPRVECPEVESCFKFNYIINDPAEWFYQEEFSPPGTTNIFWLSVAAIYPGTQLGDHPFGWKTKRHSAPPPDAAVRIFGPIAPVLGSAYLSGAPITDAPFGQLPRAWDMAFQLTSPCDQPDVLDWGDAPDAVGVAGYLTLAANGGANHLIVPGVLLGPTIDAEPDGQPNVPATGDDTNLLYPGVPDDEDGVLFTSPLIPGFNASVDVLASVPGILDVWADWTGDGDWADPGEQIFTAFPVGAGINSLAFFVPTGALGGAGGFTYARFRFNTVVALPVGGPAPNGEVEDYRIVVQSRPEPNEDFDFGDAEDPPYRTLLASTGAAHGVYTNFVLGSFIDSEPDGLPSPTFDRDDLVGIPDDEDGVTFTTFVRGGVATATIGLTSTMGPGLLDAWVDFDNDGIWAAGEQVATSFVLFPGSTLLPIPVPATAVLGDTGARFRLSSGGGLPPWGTTPNGEVEDYLVEICQSYVPSLTNLMFTNIVVTNVAGGQHITLQWNAEPNVVYQVQRATTFSNAPPILWADFGPQIVGPANTLTFTNTHVLERYYRICVPYICP